MIRAALGRLDSRANVALLSHLSSCHCCKVIFQVTRITRCYSTRPEPIIGWLSFRPWQTHERTLRSLIYKQHLILHLKYSQLSPQNSRRNTEKNPQLLKQLSKICSPTDIKSKFSGFHYGENHVQEAWIFLKHRFWSLYWKLWHWECSFDEWLSKGQWFFCWLLTLLSCWLTLVFSQFFVRIIKFYSFSLYILCPCHFSTSLYFSGGGKQKNSLVNVSRKVSSWSEYNVSER